jgi:glutathione S-transferase
MEPVTLYGFPRSTYVNVARLVLLAKEVDFTFHDTESEMGTELHRARHPFGRVPALQHGDFWLYETAAIAFYVSEAFEGPSLEPRDVRERAKMRQWIGNLDAYFYPYIVYGLVHERVVFPELGIAPDEAVVADALPRCRHALAVLEQELERGSPHIVGTAATLADFFLFPTLVALGFTAEGKALLEAAPRVRDWLVRMAQVPSVLELRSQLPPPAPIEHARHWVVDHRARGCT